MIIRTRLRTLLNQLVLVVSSVAAISYFYYQAFSGDHGIEAQRRYEQQKLALGAELTALRQEKAALTRRITLLRSDTIDPDMLEEKSRDVLGFANPNDVIVLLKK